MSDRPPSGPSRPEVYAADGSVCNNRDITLGNVEGSLNFNDEVEGRYPSGNVSQQVPQAVCVATGGSYINRDKINVGNVTGDLNFSVKMTSVKERAGAVGETLPSSKGAAVKMITSHKVELISRLMADPSFILQHVQAKEIITDREYQKVKSVAQPEEKVTELLDCVISKGEDYCSRFLDILKETDVLETYPQLEGMMSKWC
ncbi:uncharacterized protein LOC115587419 isoform X2 [Sparus aurata]|uniref:Uncharacterized LOC115587419 n=1 Tax=Sparus aurata TaxID=8175 RepID=A0A671W5H9_SPAAU|nr:uncharacterized protein LOC115587419 isoform X2 [Sparus aurata]